MTVLVILFGIFTWATARLLVWPTQAAPATVSAVVLLAGPGYRLPVAVHLAEQNRARVLVVSQGWEGYGGPCPAAIPGVRIICFDPNPGDTRGEAEHIGQLAKRYGWRSLLLVASQPQVVRAQLLMRRCFSGPAYAVAAPLPASSWPYEIAYGWGALLKAVFLERSC